MIWLVGIALALLALVAITVVMVVRQPKTEREYGAFLAAEEARRAGASRSREVREAGPRGVHRGAREFSDGGRKESV